MLSNLFVDTDVILDVLLNREDHYNNSAAIFKCFENNTVQLYTSPTVIINAHYIGQKQLSQEKCKSGIKYLLAYFNIIDASKATILQAYSSGFSDIEDAIQYFTALNAGIIDCIITRNIRDYKKATQDLPVLTPAQFLKQLK
jgi:predicted nucleic acid-binding protein